MPPAQATRKARWIAAAVFALVCLGLLSYRFISPQARSARTKLQNLSQAKVSAIMLEPSPEASLIQFGHRVTDAPSITRWVQAISPVQPYAPQHPHVDRCMYISFVTDSGTVGGKLCTLASGRIMLTQWSAVHSGLYYGSYLLPAGASLESLLRVAEQPAAAPNHSSKRTREKPRAA